MNPHQSLAIQALEQMKPSIIERNCYGKMTGGMMDTPPEERTRITAEYDAMDARIDAAIEWVKQQTG